jgi:hypothetical protein
MKRLVFIPIFFCMVGIVSAGSSYDPILGRVTSLPPQMTAAQKASPSGDTNRVIVTPDDIYDIAVANAGEGSVEVETDVYGPGWNGDDTHAPSQNVVYDYLHNFDADDDGSFADEAWLTTYLTPTEFTGLIGTAYDTEGELNALFSAKQDDLAVPSQAEAEAGVATTERVWTAQRVGQAIAALAGGGTDDQTIDVSELDGTTLKLSLESDGEATKEIDLSSLQDGTGSDDQTIDTFSLGGTTLSLSLESDGEAAKEVDLSSLQDGTGTDDQNAGEVSCTDEFDNSDATNVQDVLDDLDAAIAGGGTTLKDLVTTSPLTGGENDILPGADADVTLGITVAKDIVATSPLTVNAGGNLDNVIIGTDADITIAMPAATNATPGYATLRRLRHLKLSIPQRKEKTKRAACGQVIPKQV